MARLREPPVVAAVLVGLGLVPFVAGALGFWLLPPALAAHALDAQVFYAAPVLAFLGAVHWGAALSDGPDSDRFGVRVGWSVVPALVGWAATLMTALPALTLLMAGFATAYVADRRACDRGELPAWYLDLRRRATAVVLLALGASLLRLA